MADEVAALREALRQDAMVVDGPTRSPDHAVRVEAWGRMLDHLKRLQSMGYTA